jgi:hypothetical protein
MEDHWFQNKNPLRKHFEYLVWLHLFHLAAEHLTCQQRTLVLLLIGNMMWKPGCQDLVDMERYVTILTLARSLTMLFVSFSVNG